MLPAAPFNALLGGTPLEQARPPGHNRGPLLAQMAQAMAEKAAPVDAPATKVGEAIMKPPALPPAKKAILA